MTFAVSQQNQFLCYVFNTDRGPYSGQRVNVVNTEKGWMAQLGEMDGDVFRKIGEPRGVSNLINRRDAAEAIARLVGLE